MIDLTTTTNEAAINAAEAWLDRVEEHTALRLMVVDGEEFIVLTETPVVFELASLQRGALHRNGWYPCQIIQYK